MQSQTELKELKDGNSNTQVFLPRSRQSIEQEESYKALFPLNYDVIVNSTKYDNRLWSYRKCESGIIVPIYIGEYKSFLYSYNGRACGRFVGEEPITKKQCTIRAYTQTMMYEGHVMYDEYTFNLLSFCKPNLFVQEEYQDMFSDEAKDLSPNSADQTTVKFKEFINEHYSMTLNQHHNEYYHPEGLDKFKTNIDFELELRNKVYKVYLKELDRCKPGIIDFELKELDKSNKMRDSSLKSVPRYRYTINSERRTARKEFSEIKCNSYSRRYMAKPVSTGKW